MTLTSKLTVRHGFSGPESSRAPRYAVLRYYCPEGTEGTSEKYRRERNGSLSSKVLDAVYVPEARDRRDAATAE